MRSIPFAMTMAVLAGMSATSVGAQEAAAPILTASDSNPFVTRGAALPAILRFLQTDGVKLTFLGNEGGLKGYLGEAASGRTQAVYLAPDGNHVVAGLLVRSGGAQVSSWQIDQMLQRFNEAAKSVDGIDQQVFTETMNETLVPLVDKPIIEWFRDNGNKVTDLQSKDGGLSAYLVETTETGPGPAGLMQVYYVMPDDRYAVAGILMGRDGQQVTGIQLGRLQERFIAEGQTVALGGSQISPGVNPSPVPATTFPIVPEPSSPIVLAATEEPVQSAPPVAPIASTSQLEDDTGALAAQMLDALGGAPAPQQVAPSQVAPAPAPIVPDIPISTLSPDAAQQWKSDIPSQALLEEFGTKSTFFTVGAGPGLPTIWMVADPRCPYCHETWRQLRPLVFAKKIQLRVIMIAGLQGSDPVSRSILSMDHPDMAWLQGQGSVAGVAVPEVAVGSPAFNLGGERLQANHLLLSKFNITQTPFLAYVSDDQTYVSRGIPSSFDAFLAALK